MNNHPPLPLIHRPTTTQILYQTAAVFFTRHHLLPILFLSFALLHVDTLMENTTTFLITFTENDPSFESLFPSKPTTQNHQHHLTGDQFSGNNFTTKTRLVFSHAKLPFKSIRNNNSNVSLSINDSTVLYATGKFSVSYGFMVLVYGISQSLIHGIIFVLVVNHILQNRNSFKNTYLKGVILGSRRVFWLFLLRWLLMHLFVHILSLWFVGYEDHYSVFKILVRMKFLPFSIAFAWVINFVEGFEKEIFGFLISYITLDLLFSYVFGVCVWVVMADSRKTSMEVLREGFRLLSLSIYPVIHLKPFETIASSSFAKLILSQVFGEFLASFIQSLMMIYLMVAWMVYYFSVKSMDANSRGEPFGQREFADMLNNDR